MKSSLQTSAGLLTERLARHHADLTGSERALAEAAERLQIRFIVSIDKDFDVYRDAKGQVLVNLLR